MIPLLLIAQPLQKVWRSNNRLKFSNGPTFPALGRFLFYPTFNSIARLRFSRILWKEYTFGTRAATE